MRALLTSTAVSLSLIAAPVAFAETPARASEPMEAESNMGGSLPISVLIVLVTVLGGAIYLLADGDDDNPDSP